MSDLPEELVEEILFRVPITSLGAVRSTCKEWNDLSKNRIFGMAPTARKQFLGFMTMKSKVCSLGFDLQSIYDDDINFVDPCIKEIGKFSQVEMFEVLHCDGLLLYVTMDNSSLVVWNPYLGQTRWVKPREKFYKADIYALGYDSNNRHHKILKIFDWDIWIKYIGLNFEIYDFSSDSSRVLVDVTPDLHISFHQPVSLNGNVYFLAIERTLMDEDWWEEEDQAKVEGFLLCFDFTRERFGPRLSLPIHPDEEDLVTLSCVREEQLAVVYEHSLVFLIEIWVTTKIEPNVVSWSKFLKVDITSLNKFQFGSFFIDVEKKVAVIFDIHECDPMTTYPSLAAHFIGEDGYFKSVNIIAPPNIRNPCVPVVSSSYVPSLVQVQINQLGKRKARD